jgi:PhoPQ-activated pathogenicity-related protein
MTLHRDVCTTPSRAPWLLGPGLACLLAVVAAAETQVPAVAVGETQVEPALRAYVERVDDSFAWQVRQRTRLGGTDCIELLLTSQTWRDIVWHHRLFLIVPDTVKDNSEALLVVEGGRWRDDDARPLTPDAPPAYPRQAALLAVFAQQLQAPVAVLLNVPRQPILEGRREDQIIAYTFDQYLRDGDDDWPLLLPMVKSAVRAMDAVQAFAAEDRQLQIDRFTVTGASKRGWTTWLTAAVDSRVMALAPMVIDMLNMEAQLTHQRDAYGTFSNRISDYTDIDLPQRMHTPRGQQLRRIVDPYAYRSRLTQPKLMLLGTNDGYWTVDALNMYWDGLEGDKYIVYVPNADHDLAMDWQRVFGGMHALHRHASGRHPMPKLTWAYEPSDDGLALTVEPGDGASQVLQWSASAPTRDFRKAQWTSRPIQPNAEGRFAVSVSRPAEGYHAVYAEVVYPREPLALRLATTIEVLNLRDAAADENQ